MKPLIIYCYDAWCGWCYGFSPVIKKLSRDYAFACNFEVLSGGMIRHEPPLPIGATAGYIQNSYSMVEDRTGIRFGPDYLWHINHPDESDWFPDSLKSAIALCVFKQYYPEEQVNFAADLQYALHFEGRDLTDDEAYRHLLEKYQIPEAEFYEKLGSEYFKEEAQYEFALCRQLKVTGFPTVLLQASDTKFYLIARGYTDEDAVRRTMDEVLALLPASL